MIEVNEYDILLYGATVLTMDDNNPVIKDSLIGIKGDKISLLSSAGKTQKEYHARKKIDVSGKVITPGLVNIHTHTILSMLRGQAEDMGFAPAYTAGVPQGHQITPEQAAALARLGALEAVLFGSTVINDSHVHANVTIEAMAEMGLRVFACNRIHDVDFSNVSTGKWEYDDKIGEQTLAAGLQLAEKWNKKSNSLIRVQLTPHAPDTCSARFLRKISEMTSKTDLRIAMHLAQSRKEVELVKNRDGMTPVELLEDTGLLNDRLTAAHCIFLTESDIQRIARSGMIVAHIPKGNATGGTIAPTSKLRSAGVKIGLGSDNQHADMVEVMRWALAVGRIQDGKVSDFWQPHHVFEMATRTGSIAMGLEREIGSLEVGKQADLVVVDFQRAHLTPCLNPLGNLVHTAQGRDVEMVIVAGRVIVEDGRSKLCNEEKVRLEATKVSQELWKNAGRLC